MNFFTSVPKKFFTDATGLEDNFVYKLKAAIKLYFLVCFIIIKNKLSFNPLIVYVRRVSTTGISCMRSF